MYGLPDSAILGTARRITRGIKAVKSQPEMQTSWGLLVSELIAKADNRKEDKKTKERLAKKHRVSFTD
jgi:hypothetical protein